MSSALGADLFFAHPDLGGHGLDRAGELADLVLPAGGGVDVDLVLAGGDPGGGVGERAQRPHQPAGKQSDGDDPEDEQRAGDEQGPVPQRRDLGGDMRPRPQRRQDQIAVGLVEVVIDAPGVGDVLLAAHADDAGEARTARANSGASCGRASWIRADSRRQR